MRFTGSLNPQQTVQAVAAILLTLLGGLTLISLLRSPVANSSAEIADGQAQAQALAQWQALWTDIAEHGEAALQPEQTDVSLRAAGDTVFMRYRNRWKNVDPAARRTFQMAALANDPQQKLALLEPLTTVDAPMIRARALLEVARVHLRRRALDLATMTAQQVLAIPGLTAQVTADAYFILGYAALEAHDLDRAEAALAQAVERDPGFWDARQTQLLVLNRQLNQPRQSVAACLNRSRLMIQNLGALPALAQDRTQFRDIADRFAAQAAIANPAFRLLSGLGYLWVGDHDRAQKALAEARKPQGQLPRQCETLIAAQAAALLQRHF
jgi:tetratricopeptide (TPR) repeat protein